MRTIRTLAALSLAATLGACRTRSEQTSAPPTDLEKDLAAASAASGAYATAPQNYQRMRFVSNVELVRGGAPARHTNVTHSHVRAKVSRTPTPDPVVAVAPTAAEVTSTASAAAPEASVVVTPAPVPEPASTPVEMPMPSTEGTGAPGREGRGAEGRGGGFGGIGGILGGIIGGVVLRGGRGGVDHCDPRTDGRARPNIGRPDLGLPLPTGAPTFPGRTR